MSLKAGPDGMTDIYDIPAKKWRRVYPVDAREMIDLGTGSFTAPGEPAPVPANSGEQQSQDSDKAHDFSKHTVPDLKEMAEEAGIENFAKMNKAELIAALIAANYDPTK